MTLTRKHFEAIAEAIADIHINASASDSLYTRGVTEMRYTIAHNLADYCEGNNSRFDRRKFIKACGVEPLAHRCKGCGRVEVDCSRAPCDDVIRDRGEEKTS